MRFTRAIYRIQILLLSLIFFVSTIEIDLSSAASYDNSNEINLETSATQKFNIVLNPGFENDLSFWQSANIGTASIENSSSYDGSKCIKLSGTTAKMNVVTQNLEVLIPGQEYTLKAAIKTAPGNISKVSLHDKYWKNSSEIMVGKTYFIDCGPGDDNWQWCEEKLKIPLVDDSGESTLKHLWEVNLYGDYSEGEATYYDNIEIVPKNIFYPQFGPENSQYAKSLDLGANEARDIRYSTLSFTEIKNENGISYRSVKPRSTCDVEFPAFNTDDTGLLESPMLLEICYKDTISGFTTDKPHRAICSSRLYEGERVLQSIRDGSFCPILALGGKNDDQWKYVQRLFPKNRFPLLRSIDNKFTIKIEMPNESNEDSILLPIDYISLRAITEEEYQVYKEYQRRLQGFYEVLPDVNTDKPASVTNPELVVYSKDTMAPIYKETKPLSVDITDKISTIAANGEVESLSFAFYSKNGAEISSINVTDLYNDYDDEKISSENITIYNVIRDKKRIYPYPSKGFREIGDRLEKFTPTKVQPDTSEQVWLKCKVPSQLTPGIYHGFIEICTATNLRKDIELELMVFPVKLTDQSETLNPVYFNPYLEKYSKIFSDLIELYRESGLDIIYPLTDIAV